MIPRHRCAVAVSCLVLILTSFWLPLVLFAPIVKAAVLYNSGDPLPAEQLVLEYINRARADPVAEGQRLGIDIHEGLANPSLLGPRPPLAMNKILLGIAQAHSQDMYNLNYFSHNDPNGTTPFGRMTHAGYDYVMAGENMAGGTDLSATELEDLMMVDAGTSGRPHRVNLLDLIQPYPCGDPPCAYSEIGIGYDQGVTPNGIGLSSLITEDFGATSNTGPFLLGVVYNDVNNNNFYDIGEGIPGVTIATSSGSYYAISSSAGGYTIPIGTSGTITVTASGPGFGPITKTITLSGVNVKLDFPGQASATTIIETSSTSSTTSTASTYSSSTVTEATSTQNSQTSTSSSSSSTSSTTTSTSTSTSTTSAQVGTTTSSTVTTDSTTQTISPTTQVTNVATDTASSSVPSDFLLAADPNPISMPQASSATMTLTLQSIGGFNELVALNTANLPPGVQAFFSTNTIIPPAGGTAVVTVTLTVTRSVPTGTYTFSIWGADSAEAKQVPVTLQVSGCLIATATFGSELAPEVQFLRDFRDYKILQTFAGSSFMVAFNEWYYSFSPAVAQFEYDHPPVRAAMKIVLYPLIAILRVGSTAFDLLPMNHEAGALLSGLTISALLGTVYLGIPFAVIVGRLPFGHRRIFRELQKCSVVALAGALLVMTLSELLGIGFLMTLATSAAILSAIAASAAWTQRAVTLVTDLLHSRIIRQ